MTATATATTTTTTTTTTAFVDSVHHLSPSSLNNKRQNQPKHQQQSHNLIPSQVFRPSNKNLKQKPSESILTHHWMMMPTLTAVTPPLVTLASSTSGSISSSSNIRHVQQPSPQRSRTQQQFVPQHLNTQPSIAVSRSMQQQPLFASTASTTSTESNIAISITNNDGNLKRGRRRNRTQRKKRAAMAEKQKSSETTTTTQQRVPTNIVSDGATPLTGNSFNNSTTAASTTINRNNNFPTSGNLPDIYWRAISMEHVREHPNFLPLPEPNAIRQLLNRNDVKLFRQESWQWDTLHHGRCTTSQAVAALGFLEAKVGEVLGVPLSWRRGGMGAFVRLCVKPLRTLEEMNDILIIQTNNDDTIMNELPTATTNSPSDTAMTTSSIWFKNQAVPNVATTNPSQNKFAAQYRYHITAGQEQERKKYARKISQNENMSKSIRMMWGNTQEATSLVTAINYFTKKDPNFILEEVGMCGADLSLNRTTTTSSAAASTDNNCDSFRTISSSLLIGATPDGILRHSDGRTEVLEVKNHCPFYTNSYHGGKGTKNKGGVRKRFQIGSKPFDDHANGVFAHYVPQLQLEMLCVGPECVSAVMIRQTATAGAMILRMYRDNEWIDEMLYWLHRFQLDYVEPKKPPPKNFFWDSSNSDDRARYRRFVNKTNEIRNSRVEVVAHIHNDEIQRMGNDTSLFLD